MIRFTHNIWTACEDLKIGPLVLSRLARNKKDEISCLQRRILDDAGSDERDDDGDDVHGELELEELGNAVVHIPAPHDGLHDTAEVVVGEDNVGSLLGHIGTSNTLEVKRTEE